MKNPVRGLALKDRRAALDRWRASGLTQADFCRRERIHPATFSGWKRQFALWRETSPKSSDVTSARATRAEKVSGGDPANSFIEARLVDRPAIETSSWVARFFESGLGFLRGVVEGTVHRRTPGSSGVEVVVHQHRIALARDFDVATLRQALSALGSDTA